MSDTDWSHFIAGNIAGVVSRTLTAPIERVNISRQTSADYYNSTVWDNVTRIWTREGITGFFRGNGINLICMAPQLGLNFLGYRTIAKYIDNNFIVGSLSGAISMTVTYPLRTVRMVLIHSEQRHALSLIKDMQFYRGLPVAVAASSPYNGIMYTLYCRMKKDTPIPIAGFLSSATAACICHPLYLCSVRLQTSKLSYLEVIHDIYHQRGLRGLQGLRNFYTGLFLTIARIAPSNALSFTTANFVLTQLEGLRDS